VCGRITGRAGSVTALGKRHALTHCEPLTAFHVETKSLPNAEVLSGIAAPSTLRAVVAALPADAPFTWLGGGRFEVALANEQASDLALRRLAQAKASAVILTGPDHRRGIGTTIDQG